MTLPGIFQLTFGKPEKLTPVMLRQTKPAAKELATLPAISAAPFALSSIRTVLSARGFRIELPLDADEQIYGLGLQLLSFNQRGLKKTLRVNSDPVVDLGDSHAPVPFYVSTKGYGVLIDTARYASFYCGSAIQFIDRQSQEFDKV